MAFNLNCQIERMERRLDLVVTAKCFEVRPIVNYFASNGSKIALDSKNDNFIELKTVGSETVVYFDVILFIFSC